MRVITVAFAFGLLYAIGLTIGVSLYAGYSHHPMESFRWFLSVSFIPTVIGVVAINQCLRFKSMTRALMIGFVCFAVVTTAGMLFAPLVGIIERGYARVNVSGWLDPAV